DPDPQAIDAVRPAARDPDRLHEGSRQMRLRPVSKALLVCLTLLAAGCASASANHGQGSTASASLPSPFTIAARFSATSLGLDHPRAVAIGPNGNLYVTDRSQRVTVISPVGKVLRRWGHVGRRPGEFRFTGPDPNDPFDVHAKIAVGSDGLVYVGDSGNGRV